MALEVLVVAAHGTLDVFLEVTHPSSQPTQAVSENEIGCGWLAQKREGTGVTLSHPDVFSGNETYATKFSDLVFFRISIPEFPFGWIMNDGSFVLSMPELAPAVEFILDLYS